MILPVAMKSNRNAMNPVLPSPWRSCAPFDFIQKPKKHHPYRNLVIQYAKYEVVSSWSEEKSKPKPRQGFQEDSLFRSLNRYTLILAFPGLNASHIDKTLNMCNNNLSEAIRILKRINVDTKTTVKRNHLSFRRIQPSPSPTWYKEPTELNSKSAVTYIPTRYKDVQIVELNTNVNSVKVLKASTMTQIVPLKRSSKVISLYTPILPKINQSREVSVNSMPIVTQAAVSSTSEQWNISQVEPQQYSANQILEKVLTVYPYSVDG